jgi:hypothetical protein
MSRLTIAAAALLLAACSVELEGAACSAPGTTAECPDGQACGTGLRCSERAKRCAPCVEGTLACGADGNVKLCTAEDADCGRLAPQATCGGLTACTDLGGGTAACTCTAWRVDAAAVPPLPACTYTSVKAAIADAQAASGTSVLLGGSGTHGTDPADSGAITVPAGMTLRGDDPTPDPAARLLQTDGLVLEDGATLSGLTVRRGAGASPLVGVRIACGSGTAGVALDSVVVDDLGPGGAFETGVRVEGGCPVHIAGVVVSGASGPGLEVVRATPEPVVVSDALLDGNVTGVRLAAGDLTLDRPVVTRSQGHGIDATGAGPGTVTLTVTDGLVCRNGTSGNGIGLVLQFANRFHLTGSRVCGNAGASRSLSGTNRTVGGLFAVGDAPADVVFTGNRFHDNVGDQAVFYAGMGTWNLDGSAACDAGLNAFGNYAAGQVGVVAAGTNVRANDARWKSATPAAGTDYLELSGGGIAVTTWCLSVPDLTCPDP